MRIAIMLVASLLGLLATSACDVPSVADEPQSERYDPESLPIGDGVYKVVDSRKVALFEIQPGTYRAKAKDGCVYSRRLLMRNGRTDTIEGGSIAWGSALMTGTSMMTLLPEEKDVETPEFLNITIEASDYTFSTRACETWERID